MPIYNYRCAQCERITESIMKHDDPAPECTGHGAMQKLLSVPAFKFKNGHGTDMGSSMSIPGYPLPPV